MDRRFILEQLSSLPQFFYRFCVFLLLEMDGTESVARGAVVGLEPEHSLEELRRYLEVSFLRVDHAESVVSEEVGRLGCDHSFVGILRSFPILVDRVDLSQLVEGRRVVGVEPQRPFQCLLGLGEATLQGVDEAEAVESADVGGVQLDGHPVLLLGASVVAALGAALSEPVEPFTLSRRAVGLLAEELLGTCQETDGECRTAYDTAELSAGHVALVLLMVGCSLDARSGGGAGELCLPQ